MSVVYNPNVTLGISFCTKQYRPNKRIDEHVNQQEEICSDQALKLEAWGNF